MQMPTKYRNHSFSAGNSPVLDQYTCDRIITSFHSDLKININYTVSAVFWAYTSNLPWVPEVLFYFITWYPTCDGALQTAGLIFWTARAVDLISTSTFVQWTSGARVSQTKWYLHSTRKSGKIIHKEQFIITATFFCNTDILICLFSWSYCPE